METLGHAVGDVTLDATCYQGYGVRRGSMPHEPIMKEAMEVKWKEKGSTLLEMLAVFSILTVLILIAFPIYWKVIEHAEAETCKNNRNELERHFSMNSQLVNHTGRGDSQEAFNEYFHSQPNFRCPGKGIFLFNQGEVICSIHNEKNEPEGEKNEEVPYL